MNQLVEPGSVPGVTDLEVNDTNGLSAHVTYPERGADSVHCRQPDPEKSENCCGKGALHTGQNTKKEPLKAQETAQQETVCIPAIHPGSSG